MSDSGAQSPVALAPVDIPEWLRVWRLSNQYLYIVQAFCVILSIASCYYAARYSLLAHDALNDLNALRDNQKLLDDLLRHRQEQEPENSSYGRRVAAAIFAFGTSASVTLWVCGQVDTETAFEIVILLLVTIVFYAFVLTRFIAALSVPLMTYIFDLRSTVLTAKDHHQFYNDSVLLPIVKETYPVKKLFAHIITLLYFGAATFTANEIALTVLAYATVFQASCLTLGTPAARRTPAVCLRELAKTVFIVAPITLALGLIFSEGSDDRNDAPSDAPKILAILYGAIVHLQCVGVMAAIYRLEVEDLREQDAHEAVENQDSPLLVQVRTFVPITVWKGHKSWIDWLLERPKAERMILPGVTVQPLSSSPRSTPFFGKLLILMSICRVAISWYWIYVQQKGMHASSLIFGAPVVDVTRIVPAQTGLALILLCFCALAALVDRRFASLLGRKERETSFYKLSYPTTGSGDEKSGAVGSAKESSFRDFLASHAQES